jgi:hypothetical protein
MEHVEQRSRLFRRLTANPVIVQGVTSVAGRIYLHRMSNKSGHDDELDQKRPEQHAQQGRTGATGVSAKASAASTTSGAKSGVASGTGGAKAAIAPRVNIISPTQHAKYDTGLMPMTFEIFGTPNSTVVLYGTVYRDGKVYQDGHTEVTLDAGGHVSGTHTVPVEAGKFCMHVRAQSHAGPMSALRVVEYDGPGIIETKGGGV